MSGTLTFFAEGPQGNTPVTTCDLALGQYPESCSTVGTVMCHPTGPNGEKIYLVDLKCSKAPPP
jgi:hypothetical protein